MLEARASETAYQEDKMTALNNVLVIDKRGRRQLGFVSPREKVSVYRGYGPCGEVVELPHAVVVVAAARIYARLAV